MLGSLLAIGGSLLGSLLGGGSSKNPYQSQFDQAGLLSDELRQLLAQRFSAAEGKLADRTGQVMNDYARAESSINTQGRQGTKDILNRETQGLEATKASMLNRGLFNTTALDGAQRGVRADTTAALGRHNESIGALKSQAASRTGSARASLLGDEARLPLQRFGAEQGTLSEIIRNLLIQATGGTERWQAGRAAGAAAGSELGGQLGKLGGDALSPWLTKLFGG